MKDSVIVFCGLLILGICLIISSIIFSNSQNRLASQQHFINGSIGINQSENSSSKSEYMPIGEVAPLLGYNYNDMYNYIDDFTQDLYNGKLGDIPYVDINGKPIFSRTAFEEWLIESARHNSDK